MVFGLTRERFARVFDAGSSRRFGSLTLRWADGDGLVAFAITKKAGNKPRRNRIKRRLTEAVRAASPDLAGRDWIVSSGLRALDQPFEALVADLRVAFATVLAELATPPPAPDVEEG